MSRENDALERIRNYHASLEAPPGNWEAKRTLARAVRGLMDSLCATDAPPSELLAIAAQVEESARRFADQPRMIDPPGVAEGSLGGGMEMFMDRSPLVGLANPVAPPLRLDPNPETRIVRGSVTFGNAYEGAPGCVHGGHVAAAFDEALGMACIFSDNPGMTGEITIRYRKPTPTKTPLRIEARLDGTERRKIFTSGEIYAGDLLTAEATGIFISIDQSKFGELRAEQKRRMAELEDASG